MADDENAQGTESGLKGLFGLVSGFTAVAYVFGFLVVHAYLDPFHVAPQGLANVRYLSAGLCFSFFYAVAAILFVVLPGRPGPFAIARDMRVRMEASLAGKSPAYARGFRASFPVTFTLGYVLRLIVVNLPYYLLFLAAAGVPVVLTASDPGVFASPYLYLWSVIVMISFGLVRELVAGDSPRRMVVLPWLLSLTLLSTLIFGTRIYTHLSPSIGGGIPLVARFVIGDDVPKSVREALGDPVGDLSQPMWVLLETDHAYFVVAPHSAGPAMEIGKDLVRGVRFGRGG